MRKTDAFVALMVATTITNCLDAGGGQEKRLLDEIKRAWSQRRDSVQTLRFSWEEKCFHAKGSKIPAGMFGPDSDPIRDFEQVRECAFLIDRPKWRYEHRNKTPLDSDIAAQIITQDQQAYNGQVIKQLAFPVGEPSHHQGNAGKREAYPDSLYVTPILYTYDLPNPNELPDDLSVFPEQGVLDGKACLILGGDRSSPHRLELWVEPDAEHLVRKRIWIQDGKQDSEMVIRYSRAADAKNKWVPTEWTIVKMRDGRVVSSTTAKVVEYSINRPIEASDFELQFPPGTLVSQDFAPKRFIQLSGGKIREILPEEVQYPYDQLLATQPGDAQTRRAWTKWSWQIGLSVLILIVAYLLYRRSVARML